MSRKPENYDPQLLRGNSDMLILRIISEMGDVHGYGVIKELKVRSNGYFDFKEGTVYPLLHRLEQLGYIKSDWKQQDGAMSRRNYRITPKGVAALTHRTEIWRRFSRAMNEIFADHLG